MLHRTGTLHFTLGRTRRSLVDMLHGLECESAQFRDRDATCGVEDDEEEAFEEFQRRTRAAAKQRMAERAAEAKAKKATAESSAPPAESSAPPTIREQQEREHEQRVDTRERLLERERRLEDYVVGDHAEAVAQQEPLSVEDARAVLESNQRAQDEDATLFVQSFRK